MKNESNEERLDNLISEKDIPDWTNSLKVETRIEKLPKGSYAVVETFQRPQFSPIGHKEESYADISAFIMNVILSENEGDNYFYFEKYPVYGWVEASIPRGCIFEEQEEAFKEMLEGNILVIPLDVLYKATINELRDRDTEDIIILNKKGETYENKKIVSSLIKILSNYTDNLDIYSPHFEDFINPVIDPNTGKLCVIINQYDIDDFIKEYEQ